MVVRTIPHSRKEARTIMGPIAKSGRCSSRLSSPGSRSKIAEHAEEIDCRNRASRNRQRRRCHDQNKNCGFTCEIISCLVTEIVAADVAERRVRKIAAITAAKIDVRRRLIIGLDDRAEAGKPLTMLARSIGGSSWFHIFSLNYSFR